MRIGIIGAGNIGGALTRRLCALGHEVSVANSRGPATLQSLAAETGAKAVTPAQAARAGEIVIVTIPMRNIPHLAKNLFEGVPADVVVVDTGQLLPAAARRSDRADRAGLHGEPLGRRPAGPPGGEDVQQHLRAAPAGPWPAEGHAGPDRAARSRRRRGGQGQGDGAGRRAGFRSGGCGHDRRSPGASSRARRLMRRTSTPKVCVRRWRRPARSGRPLGGRRRTARATSPSRREVAGEPTGSRWRRPACRRPAPPARSARRRGCEPSRSVKP